jgi:hypothetical protein
MVTRMQAKPVLVIRETRPPPQSVRETEGALRNLYSLMCVVEALTRMSNCSFPESSICLPRPVRPSVMGDRIAVQHNACMGAGNGAPGISCRSQAVGP